MKPFASTLLASAAAVAALGYGSVASSSPVVAATPPPTPPPVSAPGPLASPTSLAPPNGPQVPLASPSPGASPTPPAVARKGLEGVWEVAIQHPDTTDYTHFRLAPQSGSTLTGTYLDTKGKRYPLAGSVDGQAIRLIVTMSDGTTLLLEGRLDGTTDIIGMLTTPKEQIPFTAAYRPKEKWIENVNPAPGGFGMPNAGGGPPGGGGYPPPRS